MKNILVPTDFSECAQIATEFALEIAKKANAEIHFLHLIMTPVDWVNLPKEQEDNFHETKKEIGYAKGELAKLTRRAEKMGLKSKHFLVFDKGREEIDLHTKHHKHDFIVMGSNGEKGYKGVLGSNTQRLVRKSNVPVLVIKQKPENFEIKNILFASTFNKDAIQSFKQIVDFAKLMKAQIHLLNVNTPANFKETGEAIANMEAFLKPYPNNTYQTNIINALTEERGINKFSHENEIDVIVLATHGKSGLKKLLSPSITENVINESDLPVITLHL
ncbi:universal stress protein [Brumimicrobium glaciale]|uniref:Universal stress protein n=1 Tax=Brumimicrobium glaciale TaxID=200475 RepID=A0A4Q4KJW7_9FLAO|nr:universal stress protein [Brumimicrobium glaciale]RYM33258.1 universal stress protein [Brumimicrobium glaciale]